MTNDNSAARAVWSEADHHDLVLALYDMHHDESMTWLDVGERVGGRSEAAIKARIKRMGMQKMIPDRLRKASLAKQRAQGRVGSEATRATVDGFKLIPYAGKPGRGLA